MEYLSEYTAVNLLVCGTIKLSSVKLISAELVEALLDAGAKAIVAPSNEDPDNFISASGDGDDIFQFFACFITHYTLLARCTRGNFCSVYDSTSVITSDVMYAVEGERSNETGEEVRKVATPKKAVPSN